MKWRLITIIALVIAAPAQADMTAVYSTKGIRGTIIVPVRMTVEIADNGYARYQTSDENKYGVVRDGVAYIVEARPTGPVVDRVSDIMAVQREVWAALSALALNKPDRSDSNFLNEAMKLVPIGKMTVRGREGRAYAYALHPSGSAPEPLLVMSDDPKLQPLGKFMATQYSDSLSMMPDVPVSASFDAMAEVLKTGTPLRIVGMELVSVKHNSIDQKRFSLPKESETIDQIRARMKPFLSLLARSKKT